MSALPKAWMVSDLMREDYKERDEKNKEYPYKRREFDDLIEAVGAELRDVKFCRIGNSTAVVYREGDVFALGEIGFKNTKAKGNGDLNYYVCSRAIKNDKYKDSSWQHHIVSTKVLKNAVKAASTYLKPFTCKEMVKNTSGVATTIVSDDINKKSTVVREAYRELTGNAAYIGDMVTEFMMELRNYVFINPRLNEAAAKFYPAVDEWKDAEKARKDGLYMIAVTTTPSGQYVDMAKAKIAFPFDYEVFDQQPAESVADWVKGRLAVLSMMPAQTYVQGVGLRLDDKIFYVAGEGE